VALAPVPRALSAVAVVPAVATVPVARMVVAVAPPARMMAAGIAPAALAGRRRRQSRRDETRDEAPDRPGGEQRVDPGMARLRAALAEAGGADEDRLAAGQRHQQRTA
jgi:hypothetical protein